ncbi:hypothetical protein DAI22_09g075500 [Oryza sativa Japonica Group]|nr:hypothetical protein DAI22_09g075500 [Oryza sativa Japonica Group]
MKQICRAYSSMYRQDLIQLLSQQKTTFARVACLRASEPCVRDADIARDALFGRRIDGDVLVEVVCTRPSGEVALIRQAYQARYSASLERDVSSRTSGSLNEVLLAFLGSSGSGYHGGRVDATMAMCDAKTLYEAVEISAARVDQRSVLQLLRHRSGDQLRAVLASYRRLYGQELARALKRKDGDTSGGGGGRRGESSSFPGILRAALRCAQLPERHFARAVRAALERGEGGAGADRRDARGRRRAPRQPGVRGQDRVDAGERRPERVRQRRHREVGRRLDRRLARGVAQVGLRTRD